MANTLAYLLQVTKPNVLLYCHQSSGQEVLGGQGRWVEQVDTKVNVIKLFLFITDEEARAFVPGNLLEPRLIFLGMAKSLPLWCFTQSGFVLTHKFWIRQERVVRDKRSSPGMSA